MENVEMEVTGNKLVITIDLDKRGGLSSTGKNVKVASTGGNVAVPGHEHIKIGINAYTAKG